MIPLLTRVAVAVALPTVACIGWYSAGDLRPEHSAWAVPVVLAYPLLLIGLVGSVVQWSSAKRSTGLTILAAACVLLPALLLWTVNR